MARLRDALSLLSILGSILWFSCFFVPGQWQVLEGFNWASFIVLLVLPMLGSITLVLSILFRRIWYGLLSLAFICAFPISFGLGYIVFGP